MNLFALSDLDPDFWPLTTWYGLKDKGKLKAVALVMDLGLPLLVLVSGKRGYAAAEELFKQLLPSLPDEFFADIAVGLKKHLKRGYRLNSRGVHYRMGLKRKKQALAVDTSGTALLGESSYRELVSFYKRHYPDGYFEKRHLSLGHYHCVRLKGKIIAVGGVLAFSKPYKIAALGNIATHSDHRGKGLGSVVTAKVCQSLDEHVDHIALMVHKNNKPAIKCYQKLGFEIVGEEELIAVTRTTLSPGG